MTFRQSELKNVEPNEWNKKYLSYDNMYVYQYLFIYEIASGLQLIYRCNIDRLKLMRKPLPLEGDMKYVWQKIQKVIDPLHISNHKVFLII